jgi:hypothetical protein
MGGATPARLVRRATPDDDRSIGSFMAERGADVVARLGQDRWDGGDDYERHVGRWSRSVGERFVDWLGDGRR